MAYGILVWIAAVVAQVQEPAAKQAAAPSADVCQAALASDETGERLHRSATVVAERPVRRSRRKAEGDPRRSKEGAGRAEPGIAATLALDEAECQASQGEYGKAIDGLKAAEAEHPKNADLPARLADLYLLRGDWEAAEAAGARAPRSSMPTILQARWVQARLLELRGELEKSVAAWKWFVDRYNEKQAEIVASAESLILVGQAAERYYRASARGEELADVLERRDQRHLRSGPPRRPQLLAGPHAGRAAVSLGIQASGRAFKELARAQQINPLAPEVLVTLGNADLQGYRLAAGRSQSRTSTGHESPLCAGVRAPGRSQYLGRAIRRRQGGRGQGRRREPARRRRPGAAGGRLPAAGRSGGSRRRRADGALEQPPAGEFLRRSG